MDRLIAEMDKLIAELEAAAAGSRKLDKAIYVALGLPITNHRNLDPQMIEIHLESVAPRYTTSLDAAVSWVPEECCWEISVDPDWEGKIPPSAVVCPIGESPQRRILASTPALALCVAALRAGQAMEAA